MLRKFTSRQELLDSMAYVFLYSDDPSKLDDEERKSFRDDILNILHAVTQEIETSKIPIQINWFTRAKEMIEKGISLFDLSDFKAASLIFGKAEDIFRSGISAHLKKTDFIIGADGEAHKLA